MARRSRKKKNKKTLLLVAATAAVTALLVLLMVFFRSNRAADQVSRDFSVEKYRRDGSRFASTGNNYRLEGTVENIETVNNARVVSISLKGQENERLPLLVPADSDIGVNLNRNKTYVFTVSCRTGVDEENKQVKGVLIVNAVTTK